MTCPSCGYGRTTYPAFLCAPCQKKARDREEAAQPMPDPNRTIQILPGRLYVAPLHPETPKGLRGLLGRLVNRWRAYRFGRSSSGWVPLGYTWGSAFQLSTLPDDLQAEIEYQLRLANRGSGPRG